MIRLLWLVTVGVPLSLAFNVLGVLFCLTVVGIPIGMTCFQLAGRVLMLR